MSKKSSLTISGNEDGHRVQSRILEERIQEAISAGRRNLEIVAHGQHGIGGRLWRAGDEPVHIRISGSPGQRVGSMGFAGTFIEVQGPASDDVGWLNAGAEIVVHGHATNGVGNAMAQGKIYIDGDIGARGMTMTKQNPRFAPPELWVLGSVGDSFAEFMAGGIAVICGYDTPRENILGDRPCVGMVGGKIFFRGPHRGFSQADAKLTVPDDDEWKWLKTNMTTFLKSLGRKNLIDTLIGDRSAWQILVARKPFEKAGAPVISMHKFCEEVWDRELGKGGLIGDLTDIPRTTIDLIPTGEFRRFVPLWENEKHLPPCQASCPTGIPVQKRWSLIRQGKMDEAVNLALNYTPFPATVCGYLCPNLCMQNCSRQIVRMPTLDVPGLGKASLEAKTPTPAPASGKTIAIIGGGPAGLSAAWQLWMMGHSPVVYEAEKNMGGKITATIPKSRIPDDVVGHELSRVRKQIDEVFLKKPLTRKDFQKIQSKHDFVVVASGAQKARKIPVPGHEQAMAALDFLRLSKEDKVKVGKRVV
ncbi:MAG: NAD(P)-binding protein, partial [Syntrophales bacterium]|nr:NAD(P)-binding protein [Syntrophales bacterium]